MSALETLVERTVRQLWIERAVTRLRIAGMVAAVLLLAAGLVDLARPLPLLPPLAAALLLLLAALLVTLFRDRPEPLEAARAADARHAGDELILSAWAQRRWPQAGACDALLAGRAEHFARAALSRRQERRAPRPSPWVLVVALTGLFLLALPDPAPAPGSPIAGGNAPRARAVTVATGDEAIATRRPTPAPATAGGATPTVSPPPSMAAADEQPAAAASGGDRPSADHAARAAADRAAPAGTPAGVGEGGDRAGRGAAQRTREIAASRLATSYRDVVLDGDRAAAGGGEFADQTAEPSGASPRAVAAAQRPALPPEQNVSPAERRYLARYFATGEER